MSFSLTQDQIAAIIVKNDEAFSDFYHQSFDVFFGYCKRKTSWSDSVIYDVLGDVYIKIRDWLDDLNEPQRFVSYTWTILRNHITDCIKKTNDIHFSSLNYKDGDDDSETTLSFEDTLASDDDVKEWVSHEWEIESLHAALQSLPPQDAELIYQKIGLSLAYDELACIHNQSPDGLRKRVSRILASLKKNLWWLSS